MIRRVAVGTLALQGGVACDGVGVPVCMLGCVRVPASTCGRNANSVGPTGVLVGLSVDVAAGVMLDGIEGKRGSGNLRMVDGASGRGKRAANCSRARSTVLPETSSSRSSALASLI